MILRKNLKYLKKLENFLDDDFYLEKNKENKSPYMKQINRMPEAQKNEWFKYVNAYYRRHIEEEKNINNNTTKLKFLKINF